MLIETGDWNVICRREEERYLIETDQKWPPAMQLTREEIMQRIPHRDPFLWLDRVLEMTDEQIIAEKDLPESLDVFRGHYPDFSVLPGVLQCEAAFQASAVLIADIEPTEAGQVPVVTRLNNTQFRRMIRPGETMRLEVKINERLGKAFYLAGRVLVDGQVATRLEFVCTATDAPQ